MSRIVFTWLHLNTKMVVDMGQEWELSLHKAALLFVLLSSAFHLESFAQDDLFEDVHWTSSRNHQELKATTSGRAFIVTQDPMMNNQLLLLDAQGKIKSITNLNLSDNTVLIDYQLMDNGRNYTIVALFLGTRYHLIAIANLDEAGNFIKPLAVVDSSRADLQRAGGPFMLLPSEDGMFAAWTKLSSGIEKGKLLWDYKIINSSGLITSKRTTFINFDPALQYHTRPYLSGKNIHVIISDLPGIDSRLGSNVQFCSGSGTDSIITRNVYVRGAKPLQFVYATNPKTKKLKVISLYEDFYEKQVGGLLMMELQDRQIPQYKHTFSKEFSKRLRSGVLGVAARKTLNNIVLHSATLDSVGNTHVVLYAKLNKSLVRHGRPRQQEIMKPADAVVKIPQKVAAKQDLNKIHETYVQGKIFINELEPADTWNLTTPAVWSYKETHIVMSFSKTFQLKSDAHLQNFIRTGNTSGPSFSFLTDTAFVLFTPEPRAPSPGQMKVSFLNLQTGNVEASKMSLEKNPFYRYSVIHKGKRKFLTFTLIDERLGITEFDFADK